LFYKVNFQKITTCLSIIIFLVILSGFKDNSLVAFAVPKNENDPGWAHDCLFTFFVEKWMSFHMLELLLTAIEYAMNLIGAVMNDNICSIFVCPFVVHAQKVNA